MEKKGSILYLSQNVENQSKSFIWAKMLNKNFTGIWLSTAGFSLLLIWLKYFLQLQLPPALSCCQMKTRIYFWATETKDNMEPPSDWCLAAKK